MNRLGKYTIIVSPDEKHVWEPDDTTLGEGLMIESEYGRPYKMWIEGVRTDDITAFQVLVWYLRRKAGKQQELGQVSFKLADFDIVPIDDESGDGEADPEASAGSEPATSPSSPPTTESDPGTGGNSHSLTSVA